jgi:hypothetical protein
MKKKSFTELSELLEFFYITDAATKGCLSQIFQASLIISSWALESNHEAYFVSASLAK